MKKTIFILILLITGFSYSQDPATFVDGVKTTYFDSLKAYTTAELNAMTNIPLGRKAFSSDDGGSTGSWVYWDGTAWQDFGGGGSQTLQQTTDLGATTSNAIIIRNNSTPSLTVEATDFNKFISVLYDRLLYNSDGFNFNLRMPSTLTGNYNLQVPNLTQNDTIATQSYVDANSGNFDPSSSQTIAGDWSFLNLPTITSTSNHHVTSGGFLTYSTVSDFRVLLDSDNNSNSSSFYITKNNEGVLGSIFTVNENGVVVIHDYGSGNITGVPTFNLSIDANGNIIETPNPSGSGFTPTDLQTDYNFNPTLKADLTNQYGSIPQKYLDASGNEYSLFGTTLSTLHINTTGGNTYAFRNSGVASNNSDVLRKSDGDGLYAPIGTTGLTQPQVSQIVSDSLNTRSITTGFRTPNHASNYSEAYNKEEPNFSLTVPDGISTNIEITGTTNGDMGQVALFTAGAFGVITQTGSQTGNHTYPNTTFVWLYYQNINGTLFWSCVNPVTAAEVGVVTPYRGFIGDGSATTYNINHNYNFSYYSSVLIKDVTTNEVISPGSIVLTNNNSIAVTFATAPATNNYEIVITGVATAPDTENPTAPTGLGASNPTSSTVDLAWTAATDNTAVTNHKVYQDAVEIATIGNVLTYQVTGLTASTSYDFTVTALDAAGNESVVSNTATLSTTAGGGGSDMFYDVSAQTTTGLPESLAFSEDGTKMYVTDRGLDLFQYTLSTAWDISTATYDSVNYASAEGGQINDIHFRADGLKMYLVDAAVDAVFEYDLSTAWDISTATYTTNTISVTTEDTEPTSLSLSTDGTKMYVLGDTGNNTHQYTLSTPWDLSTATYDTVVFAVAAQEGNPKGIYFKPDGTQFFLVGYAGDDVNAYTLSTAWDLSTASFDGDTYSILTEDDLVQEIHFKPDGTEMYIIGWTNDTVYRYTLSTPWDITTASN